MGNPELNTMRLRDPLSILVATGISASFTELDPGKTQALVEAVHG